MKDFKIALWYIFDYNRYIYYKTLRANFYTKEDAYNRVKK